MRERERERWGMRERDVARSGAYFREGGRVKWRRILGCEKNTCTPTGMTHSQLPSKTLLITKIEPSKAAQSRDLIGKIKPKLASENSSLSLTVGYSVKRNITLKVKRSPDKFCPDDCLLI
ncbi:hypothetical protein RHGRI_029212 [Rhododendron griersonianum]|uniref:Uncharacterized protein n=1 Tax=Rhododendron griersonianum TaxID=479676 RepID=A0AAV6ILW9_9ERIC|nr:hypothetical protein RHGRI_029212 [Rhododendron griersonianum]